MNELQKEFTILKIQDCSDTITGYNKMYNINLFMLGVMSVITLTSVACYLNSWMDEKAVYISMFSGCGVAIFNRIASAYESKINIESQKKESLEIMLKLDELNGNTKIKK